MPLLNPGSEVQPTAVTTFMKVVAGLRDFFRLLYREPPGC
jgi:hypothetical protein